MAVGEGFDEPAEGVSVRADLVAVGDLPSGIFGSDGEEVIGQSSPAQGGVAGFLEQGVISEKKGMVDGDALGAKDREGVSQVGGLLQVRSRQGDALPRGQLDDERCVEQSLSSGRRWKAVGVTLVEENVTLPGRGAVQAGTGDGDDGGERAIADRHRGRPDTRVYVSEAGTGVLLKQDAVPDGKLLARGEADLFSELASGPAPLPGQVVEGGDVGSVAIVIRSWAS